MDERFSFYFVFVDTGLLYTLIILKVGYWNADIFYLIIHYFYGLNLNFIGDWSGLQVCRLLFGIWCI